MKQLKLNVLKYSVFTSYVKFNCSSKFKFNEHRLNNYIFPVIPFELRYNILFPSP